MSVIVQADAIGTPDIPGDSSGTIGSLMGAEIPLSDFGYPGAGSMKMSDLGMLSLQKKDGRFIDYMRSYLDCLYPWQDSYFLKVTYGNVTETAGKDTGSPRESSELVYQVQYGGELRVSLILY